MSPELRQECIEVVQTLLNYLEGGRSLMALTDSRADKRAGEDAGRAERLLLELKR